MAYQPAHTRRGFLIGAGQGAAVIAGVTAGIGRARTTRAASAAVIGYDPVPCNASPIVAQAQGFFRDEGLDASLVERHPGLVDLSTGVIDVFTDGVSWGLMPPLLPSGLSLGDLIVTAVLHRGCFALVVAPDSSVRTLADLRGTSVAGSPYLWGEQLVYAGLDPAADVTWRPRPPTANALDALASGSVAAVEVADGWGSPIERAGRGRVLTDMDNPPNESDYCCSPIMTAHLVSSDQPKAAAITRALMRGAVWAETHRVETAGLIGAYMRDDLALGVGSEQMEAALGMCSFVPAAEAARPILVDQFTRYVHFGPGFTRGIDARSVLDAILVPVTGEVG